MSRKKDMALEWLKKNDPEYNSETKKDDVEYPYLTEKQLRRRRSREIPASYLTGGEIRELFGESCEDE